MDDSISPTEGRSIPDLGSLVAALVLQAVVEVRRDVLMNSLKKVWRNRRRGKSFRDVWIRFVCSLSSMWLNE